jgi:hypothetical protein
MKRMDTGRFPQSSGWPARQDKREMDGHDDTNESRGSAAGSERAL